MVFLPYLLVLLSWGRLCALEPGNFCALPGEPQQLWKCPPYHLQGMTQQTKGVAGMGKYHLFLWTEKEIFIVLFIKYLPGSYVICW